MRKLSDPLVVDRWTDAAVALTWTIFGAWSVLYLVGALTHGPSLVSHVAGHVAALVWASILAAASFACASCAVTVMSAADAHRRFKAARLEQAVSTLATFFAVAYAIWELARLIAEPSWGAPASLALSLYYPLWPAWRLHELGIRIPAMKAAIPEAER